MKTKDKAVQWELGGTITQDHMDMVYMLMQEDQAATRGGISAHDSAHGDPDAR